MHELALYDNAVKALEEAVAIDEVKEVHNQAVAIRLYAKQSDNRELEANAVKIRMRAMRKMGELLQQMDKNKGGNFSRAIDNPPEQIQAPDQFASLNNKPLTIEELGVDRHLSSQAQKLADQTEEKFESNVEKEVRRILTRTRGTFGTGEVEWYTPPEYIALAREVLGGEIDLDPASCDEAQQSVQAGTHYTKDDDGLTLPWHGNVWLNPPYSSPEITLFTEKMIDEYARGNIEGGVLLTNNSTDTGWFQNAAKHCTAMCFTRGRIGFLDAPNLESLLQGKEATQSAPPTGQTFFYFGGDLDIFYESFSDIGIIIPGAL
jgi:hypothetical protein